MIPLVATKFVAVTVSFPRLTSVTTFPFTIVAAKVPIATVFKTALTPPFYMELKILLLQYCLKQHDRLKCPKH